MAVEVGLEVEQLYATEVQRFSVRVSGVLLVDDQLLVGDGDGTAIGGVGGATNVDLPATAVDPPSASDPDNLLTTDDFIW